jgi:predicted  nucleic acid-binding Zn-ribbon protein
MPDWKEVLEALALCEKHLATLGREREQLPRSIDETEQDAEDARRRLDVEREAFTEFERSRREQESELQDCEARRDRYRSQSAQVKTNEEYSALLHEIDAVTNRISELEEGILVAMEEIDERGERVTRMEAEEAGLEQDRQDRIKGFRERLEQVLQEIKERESEREGWVERLDTSIQVHYRSIVRARGGGIAHINGRTCAACYRDIPYETVNRVIAGEVHTCPSCQRLLVGERG